MPADFWLYRWIDEFQVSSIKTAVQRLKQDKAALVRLDELASADRWSPLGEYKSAGPAILAGRGIDLSGDLGCSHHDCQTAQVDALFSRVLHYFDDIIVAGPAAHRYVGVSDHPSPNVLENLGEHVGVLLYLRKMGVEDMLHFAQKPPACEQHWTQHAAEAGLTELVDSARSWIDHLATEGQLRRLDKHEDHWHYTFVHKDLEHTQWGVVKSSIRNKKPTKVDVADAVFGRFMAHLVSDVIAARQLHLPLGAGVALHEDVLGTPSTAVDIGVVAFELELPVLSDLPIREIVKIRQDEFECFLKFRHALTAAIKECAASGVSNREAADRVCEEFIEPAIVDIAARLRSAERTLNKSAGAAAVLGALVTTAGVLTAVPLVVEGGIAAVGFSVPALQKYFDKKGSVELSDMYFLWRLEERAAKHQNH